MRSHGKIPIKLIWFRFGNVTIIGGGPILSLSHSTASSADFQL